MPVMSSNGRVLGTIGTYFREARTPTERERQVVELLCRTAALAIERRVAEEAARSSGARMELVVRGADVGVWYCPLPFDKLIWDERVKAHFHLPPDAEVTLDTFYERLHPEDREPTRAAITRSIEARELYDVDYRTISPDGKKQKWIRAVGRAFFDASGHPIRFDGVTVDVTARKGTEHALRRHVDTLASLSSVNLALASATNTEIIVQTVTDAGTTPLERAFGAFFYNVVKRAASSICCIRCRACRARVREFPMPREHGRLRADVPRRRRRPLRRHHAGPAVRQNAPHHGMPQGHLPVRSYLAVPVISRRAR